MEEETQGDEHVYRLGSLCLCRTILCHWSSHGLVRTETIKVAPSMMIMMMLLMLLGGGSTFPDFQSPVTAQVGGPVPGDRVYSRGLTGVGSVG